MTSSLRFVAQRVPFLDPNTNLISREWYLVLQALFSLISTSEQDLSGLMESLRVTSTSEHISAIAIDELRNEIASLRSNNADLQRQINEIKDRLL